MAKVEYRDELRKSRDDGEGIGGRNDESCLNVNSRKDSGFSESRDTTPPFQTASLLWSSKEPQEWNAAMSCCVDM